MPLKYTLKMVNFVFCIFTPMQKNYKEKVPKKKFQSLISPLNFLFLGPLKFWHLLFQRWCLAEGLISGTENKSVENTGHLWLLTPLLKSECRPLQGDKHPSWKPRSFCQDGHSHTTVLTWFSHVDSLRQHAASTWQPSGEFSFVVPETPSIIIGVTLSSIPLGPQAAEMRAPPTEGAWLSGWVG